MSIKTNTWVKVPTNPGINRKWFSIYLLYLGLLSFWRWMVGRVTGIWNTAVKVNQWQPNKSCVPSNKSGPHRPKRGWNKVPDNCSIYFHLNTHKIRNFFLKNNENHKYLNKSFLKNKKKSKKFTNSNIQNIWTEVQIMCNSKWIMTFY